VNRNLTKNDFFNANIFDYNRPNRRLAFGRVTFRRQGFGDQKDFVEMQIQSSCEVLSRIEIVSKGSDRTALLAIVDVSSLLELAPASRPDELRFASHLQI
jgi:hypothetical protein